MERGQRGGRSLAAAHRELWELVRDEVRRLIISGEYAPGQLLVESALAARFDVSRGPVRTALMNLERVGLVQWAPRRGIQVATFDVGDIDELFAVTQGLEQIAVRAAAERASPADVSALERLLEVLDRAQRSSDSAGAVDADLALHRQLVVTSGNSRLAKLWDSISEQIRYVVAIVQRALPEVAWATYNQPIVAAIAARDPDRAEREVVRCFRDAHARVRDLLPRAAAPHTAFDSAGAAIAG